MPRLSRWFIRAALLYLAMGFTIGALMLANKGMPFAAWLWRLRSTHIEVLLVGWTMQLALGVAYWILPRFGGKRGDETSAWAAFGLLNVGVLLVGLEAALGLAPLVGLAGKLAEVAAAAAFARHAWPRIKPAGA